MTDDRLTRRRLLAGVATGAIAVSAGCGSPGAGPSPADDGIDSPDEAVTESPIVEGTPTDGSPTEMETETETERGSPTDTEAGTPAAETVQVGTVDEFGDVLVGPEGLTLYVFTEDTQDAGESTCTDDCAENWPPLTVEGEPTAGEDVTATLSTVEREDGTTQVASNGWPLYYFASDMAPGEANGQGLNDAWWVVAPDGTPIEEEGMGTPTGTENGTPTG